MDIQTYLKNRLHFESNQKTYRTLCSRCTQPDFSCYCKQIKKFDPAINFVVLIHPIEAKRRIATGRMSHLSLENSYLIKGQDYTNNSLVNERLEDSSCHSVILYPGQMSQNLTNLNAEQRAELFPTNKKLQVFVIDGTWATARKMVRQSRNLQALPRICFIPPAPSNFRVRKQPNSSCFSTIEAIHHTIELIGPSQGFSTAKKQHDGLLNVFNFMVENQLEFIRNSNSCLRETTYRREGQKKIA